MRVVVVVLNPSTVISDLADHVSTYPEFTETGVWTFVGEEIQ